MLSERKVLSQRANRFILSLSAADLGVAVLVMLPSLVTRSQPWNLGAALCQAWVTADVLLSTASIYNMIGISMDRFQAVFTPVSYAARSGSLATNISIMLAWLVAVLVALPMYIDSPGFSNWTVITRQLNTGELWWYPSFYNSLAQTILISANTNSTSKNNNFTSCSPPYDDLSKGYSVYAALVAFIIPVAILISCYLVITIKMRSKTQTKIKRIKSKITSTAWISTTTNQNHNIVCHDNLKVYFNKLTFITKSINLLQRCRVQDLKMQFPSLILRMRPQKAALDKELNLCIQTKVSR